MIEDAYLKLTPRERTELLDSISRERGLAPAVLEKDYWVCQTLHHLFTLPGLSEHLVFKGGTSLSKVYGLIERFSEDIDISFHRSFLGFGDDRDPECASGKERNRRLNALQRASETCIRESLLPSLHASIADQIGSTADWSLRLDPQDPQTLFFQFPVADISRPGYLLPSVRIELGARSDHWPSESHKILSYIGEGIGQPLGQATVRALAAERTFWEKATLLHAEAHRAAEQPMPARYARHYYDLARLATTRVADHALQDTTLRRRVPLLPLRDGAVESGVGRWETIPLPTLSFGEYLRLREIEIPALPTTRSLREVFDWGPGEFTATAKLARPLTAHFHEYLLRGGFPEPAMVNDLTRCQRLLREDIVDKVLKRDMTTLYGVRRVLEVEKIFLYLCYHDGGILDVPTLSRELDGINRQSVNNFLDLFEATHLIYRLRPFGYGKEVLRGRSKLYLADAALPGAVLLLGRRLLEKPDRLGAAVETAFFKHLFTRYYADQPVFSYWQDKANRNLEVDVIAQLGDRVVPFEVKYQDTGSTVSKLKGLRLFMEERGAEHGYVISQRWEDFGLLQPTSARKGYERIPLSGRILSIPAPLACYWLSA